MDKEVHSLFAACHADQRDRDHRGIPQKEIQAKRWPSLQVSLEEFGPAGCCEAGIPRGIFCGKHVHKLLEVRSPPPPPPPYTHHKIAQDKSINVLLSGVEAASINTPQLKQPVQDVISKFRKAFRKCDRIFNGRATTDVDLQGFGMLLAQHGNLIITKV